MEDLEADFFAIYGIEDPWSMPARRFFPLAMRLFYYQGTMQYRLVEQQQEESPQRRPTQEPIYGPPPRKSDGSKDEEVTVVPLAGLMAMMPGLGEYSQVKKDDTA